MRSAESGVRGGAAAIAFILAVLCSGAAFAGEDQGAAQKLAVLKKLPAKFSFVVLGDNRAGDPACDAVYQKLIAAAAARKPDVVVNTGDQIDQPGNLGHWRRFRELSRAMPAPYFLTVGNHDAHVDVSGSEQTYIDQVDLPGREIYYSFTAGNALFIVLDSYRKGEDKRITGDQFAWLEGLLAGSHEKLRFVFVHHPLFPEQGRGKHYGNSLDRYQEERDRLHALFKKHGVTMVFAGHEHLYLRRNVDGIPYVITGGGGAPLYADDVNGGFHHYLLLTVDGERVAGEVVDINGRVRDTF
jgi:3',5'-cyclic AMP phosphodiesterase CpdA